MDQLDIDLDSISCAGVFNNIGMRVLCSNYGRRDDMLTLRVVFSLITPEQKYRVDYVDIHSFEILECLLASQAHDISITEVFVIRPELNLPERFWTMDRLINISVKPLPAGGSGWFYITAKGKPGLGGVKSNQAGLNVGPESLIFERH
ncbi:hypothetical protein [Pseudomonas sp. PDM11]|uniref:hypothetical protein n=1 Tax=Pseudomonas sp. PDM11 TaxID=2769309 RepID=UPI00177AAD11|nr:hypothetical protein [Pseudomonas sp. PDM11]MBD9399104.1 hypothetical protein [Pseudomonas sp. PDM11]